MSALPGPPRPAAACADPALLALCLAGGASAPRRRLLDHCGSPAAALAAGAGAWRAAGLDPAQIAALQRPDRAAVDAALAWLALPRRHLLGCHDPDYPALLLRSPNPPLALYLEGDPEALWHPAVAVVGSRAPSAGGRDNAQRFAQALATAGFAVTSGMAAGVDAAAHAAALSRQDGLTVAVVGTGPDLAYPRQHAALRERIAARGAVVSEHPPGTPARPGHFPARNRIIAGLTLATLVIEAAARSGALITARLAAEAGREVFALPGSIHNPLARGCHRLIRDGAGLVESADEVLAGVAPLAAELADALRGRLHSPTEGMADDPGATPCFPDPDYQRLWQALGHDPTCMDSVISRTGLTAAAASAMLLTMELDGYVAVERGRYTRKP
ncbi:DNA-processing protein DprA [Xanthomonas cerealis]|uniref:DNA-processing protein DprA n=1 Tax=Xanthomonas cerealis TaxID=3390025 RepID=UPI00068FBA6D|nr:DNA-processing protein DprA [Xanthomonas translucens]UKE47594.1 DNA-processing protein DprA [Xanthomonas translucens pv. cerealis]UKE69955.1 DNA-processing protein DprA [Xanthomonas translucens pv. pistacia]